MSESNHTPGPWSVEDPMGADVGLWIVQTGLEPRQWSCIAVVTDDADGGARDEGGRFIGCAEQQANARLIAAAPEMFDALKAMRSAAMAIPENWSDAMMRAARMANSAIAKAEGRS